MAKIVDLEVGTVKIANVGSTNGLTEFFWPTSGPLGTSRHISVPHDGYAIPILIWIEVDGGTSTLYAHYGTGSQTAIYTASAPTKMAVVDVRPPGAVAYGLSGGSALISGAMKRFR